MGSRREKAIVLALALVVPAAVIASSTAPSPRPSPPLRGGEGDSPSAPLGLSAIPASSTQIVLAWVALPSDAARVAGYEVLQDGEPVLATTGVTASLGDLSPWREYCFVVRARDRAGNVSVDSKRACARTLDTRPPTTPAGVTITALSESELAIAWAPSTDDAGIAWYDVRREEKGSVTAVEETHAREKHLERWTRYCYSVRARDLAGNWSSPSPEACGRTLETVPPSPPPALVARAKSDTEVELAWGNSTADAGIARYEVSRDGARFAQGPATHTHQGGLKPARRYCYDVVAVDEAGNRSQPSSACAETPDLTAPTAPGELVAAAASASVIQLEWKPSTDDAVVAGYEVLEGEKVVAKPTTPYSTAPSLAPGTEHCYRVRAFDAAGHRSAEAGPACARTTTDVTAPGSPTRLRATPVEGGIVLEWDPAPGATTAYSISRENDHPLGATQSTRFTVRALKPGERHCYRVAAVDDVGRFSLRSLPACAVPLAGHAGKPIRSNVAAASSGTGMPVSRD
jgi:large repetitive protein